MSAVNQQLKKGVLEILVLKIISEEDVYGYDLIKKLEKGSDGLFSLKEGSLYPILYRLEDRGMIKHYRMEVEGKRNVPRKYYKMTEEGNTLLEQMIGSWNDFSQVVTMMLSKEVL